VQPEEGRPWLLSLEVRDFLLPPPLAQRVVRRGEALSTFILSASGLHLQKRPTATAAPGAPRLHQHGHKQQVGHQQGQDSGARSPTPWESRNSASLYPYLVGSGKGTHNWPLDPRYRYIHGLPPLDAPTRFGLGTWWEEIDYEGLLCHEEARRERARMADAPPMNALATYPCAPIERRWDARASLSPRSQPPANQPTQASAGKRALEATEEPSDAAPSLCARRARQSLTAAVAAVQAVLESDANLPASSKAAAKHPTATVAATQAVPESDAASQQPRAKR
jgi:hypothetical protein